MGKRKITRRQFWRIKRIHEDRLNRLSALQEAPEPPLEDTLLGSEQEGTIVARHGPSVEVEDATGHLYSCYLRQNLDDLATGDKVIWRQSGEHAGVVVALIPRKTVLMRPDFHGHPKPLAANISQMVIVFAPEPEPSMEMINKYLVAAELLNIKPLLIVNKADLLKRDHLIHQWLAIYESLNYSALKTSIYDVASFQALQAALVDESNVFLGQSGVGKSSLIQHLIPDSIIRTGELSIKSGLGKHTTTAARLYHLPMGGTLIDSPGVRNFTLWQLPINEVIKGFVECRPYLGLCKFSDCSHQQEPDCAIKRALREGHISLARYTSLEKILKGL